MPTVGWIDRLLLLPDGSILALGGFTYYNQFLQHSLVLIHPDGSLDTHFNLSLEPGQFASFAYILRNGQILLCVSSPYGTPEVKRISANGRPDAHFHAWTNGDLILHNFLLQPSGKMLVTGKSISTGIMKIFRLLPDGDADSNFSCDAQALLAVQPDGKILEQTSLGIGHQAIHQGWPGRSCLCEQSLCF